ncbi:AfsR/SARP family transcriptional regulator [Streptomyces albireticuli]|uniref:AfsR/SARP family transcriptional regulator n=1 Tax=Streptomyces albireticuli TaxID=1940 RepID=UPI003695820D
MDIRILGPLAVRSVGGEAAPTAPKPRQVLALLAARTNEVVSTDMLVDELWESSPPASAVTVVQTYIVLLRRTLSQALRMGNSEVARHVLSFKGWGYRLASGAGTHDASEFLRYAELGRRALENGENEKASALLRRGLGLWRGPALADIKVGSQLLAYRTSLEESRLSVVEQRAEADLRLGRHHALLSELSGLVIQHPLHENLHSLFIISLYRSGRPGQALKVFQQLRHNLREDLGIDPSPRMWRLHQAILTADAGLQAAGESKLFPLELGVRSG